VPPTTYLYESTLNNITVAEGNMHKFVYNLASFSKNSVTFEIDLNGSSVINSFEAIR